MADTIYGLFSYFDIVDDIVELLPNKFYILIPMSLLWSIIYFGIARPKRFLNYDFEKDKKGGWRVIIYILLTATFIIFEANFNRTKLTEEHLENTDQTEQVQKKPSLEGKVRKWFKDNF